MRWFCAAAWKDTRNGRIGYNPTRTREAEFSVVLASIAGWLRRKLETKVYLVGELFEGRTYCCCECGMVLLHQLREGRWVAFHDRNYGCRYDKAEFILPTVTCDLVSPITVTEQSK